MLYFSVIMFFLALTAQHRGPMSSNVSALWFFISWLPGELPWLFAAIQVVGTFLFIVLSTSSELKEISSLIVGLITLVMWFKLHLKTLRSGQVLQTSLHEELGENFESTLTGIGITSPAITHKHDWLYPFRYKRPGVERLQNIIYGNAERNRLDIYRAAEVAQNKSPRPVVLHVHGGAWVIGNKHQQAQPLINYLAVNGWICVDINYRLAPHDLYPACLVDVKKAIAWIKENIENYGGDPSFIAVTGGSAGGHLCTLAALTGNASGFQPDFESIDTHVNAVVSVYGVYDFTNYHDDNSSIRRFLELYVMPKTFLENLENWEIASPLFQISEMNLPTFIIHGDKDCVVSVKQAQNFVQALRQKNKAPVVYAELPGAQHGFDIFHSVRTEFHVEAVGKFLNYCYTRHKNCDDALA